MDLEVAPIGPKPRNAGGNSGTGRKIVVVGEHFLTFVRHDLFNEQPRDVRMRRVLQYTHQAEQPINGSSFTQSTGAPTAALIAAW